MLLLHRDFHAFFYICKNKCQAYAFSAQIFIYLLILRKMLDKVLLDNKYIVVYLVDVL